ncbi:MAG: DUF420 domain-containing protein [Planctomycetaceae bacterium]|nr:DUF420 domain-containing protein [Planctomycetaceae bacterium]
MSNGFLGYDTSLMLDVVVVALIAVVPAILFSLFQVKVKQNYVLHRNIQLGLAVVLLIAVGAFEVDMQIVHGGWENVVNKTPETPRRSAEEMSSIQNVLWIHLVFAVTTPVLWGVTIALALKRMPKPPGSCEHSGLHKKLGWLSVVDITLTSVTGLWFYYVAFIS